MLKPEEIPQFTGDLAQLEKDYAGLKKDAGNIRDAGADVHSQFQGLSAYYHAPEAEQLFATTKPVKDRADAFADDLETVSSALSSYATEITPLVAKLKRLKTDAAAFVDSVQDDDEWEYDGDKVDEHNRLRDDITATVAAFWAAERTCHNKITALWGGTQMVAGDGSDRKDQYGFAAEDMKNAKLPWGDPVEEKHHWYDVGHWVKSFVWDGLVVDGIWGTIKGLGTLVGFGGWEAMGQAWKGLAQLATGLALSSIPGVGAMFWSLPEDKLPSWIRDSRTAMKETGKALVAWDEWGKNPARAAGAVTFNVLTTVFTGGAGGAAAGAGKAGAVAKALSVAGKAGRVIDPMTYVMKGAGAGLSKIGDISAALKGIGNIDIPALPENAFALPDGAVKLPGGTFELPRGTALPDGATRLPDGSVRLPDDVTALPPGTVKLPTEPGVPAQYMDPDGNLLDSGGNPVQQAADGPGDIVDQPGTTPHTSGADTPRVDSPAHEPALVGAGTATADNAGQAIRLGSDGLDDLGRVGDDLNTPGTRVESPGGTADHTPGGVADHLPANSVDHVTAATGVGRDAPVGPDHQVPSGSLDNAASGSADTGLRPGGPRGPIAPGALDDLAGRFGDDALGDLGRTGDDLGDVGNAADDAPPPANRADEGADSGTGPERELTPEQRQQILDEQIHKANNDPAWFEKYYRSDGHRLDVNVKENGVELPVLAKDRNGNWVSRHSLPLGPSEVRLNPAALDRGSVAAEHIGHLDDVAKGRRLSVDLTNAERAFEKNPSAATEQALESAREAYADQLGDLPNNSSISERLGEEAASRHVVPVMFPDAELIELPRTANGANMFDQLYKLEDGSYLIVEAKAPKGDLLWRQGAGDAGGMMVKQGTKEYVQTIIDEMENRGPRSPKDGRMALELAAALKNQKLQYVMVKANENTGSYAGATLEHFKID